MFNENQPLDEQQTRAVTPVSPVVEARPSRRRRTERFAGIIDEDVPAEAAEAAEDTLCIPAAEPLADAPAGEGATLVTPLVRSVQPAEPTGAWMQSRVPARTIQQPSQGVPRPSALSGQPPRREQEGATLQTPAVRRPVKAEGYSALQQLGTQEQPRVRRPEPEAPRRVRTPESERVAYEDVHEEESEVKGRGLIVVILILLVLAAAILGLIMIPEDDPGTLGSIKRAVTEPVKGFLNDTLGIGSDEDSAAPATARNFRAEVSHTTAPYKVIFQLNTSLDVTAIRVVDSHGFVIPTTTTFSSPSSEDAKIWQFELTLENGYEGLVFAQLQHDGQWLDTGLSQRLNLGAAATDAPTPTIAPTQAPVEEPVEDPTATPAPSELPVAADITPVEESTGTPAPTENVIAEIEEVTPTPTLSVTATPTLVPTATPSAEPTGEPTPEPTAAPTEEPTAAPTATPVVTPKLEAMADDSADPALITTTEIYKDGKKASSYEREKPLNMPASDAYLTRAFGVTTFRGNAFRQNAAVDNVASAEALTLEWTVEAGSIAGSSRNYYGIGWTGQPVIAKWPSDIRKGMNLEDARKEQKNLKEVIVAGLDGQLYFLDLLDGTATRDAINFGYPMRATPSLHPLSYPMMTFGQYARKLKSGTGDSIGLYYYNLLDQKRLRLIDGLDRKLERPYYSVGAFDTSALIDRNTNTLVAIGTNGLLYTETLSMEIYGSADGSGIVYNFSEPTEVVTMMSHTKGQKEAYAAVESSLAMYGCYAYYADMDGILRCVDTTTMTTMWAVDTGDAVRAAIALDLEEGEGSNTLWLYTANLIMNGRTKGDVTIRRFNAMTGEEDWAFAIHCAEGKKKDVTFNNTIIPGAMASPVIGQHGLSDLVYFTLSGVSATGAQKLSGDGAMDGVIIAFSKATGEVVWHKAMEAYCYASPVAVYAEDGRGWIIQACSNGTLYLMDGLTGETINTLAVNGVIEGSPAVYADILVIGTTGKDSSYIYGIKIQ